MPLDPECEGLLAQLAELGLPPLETLTVEQNRDVIMQFRDAAGPPEDVARVENVEAPGPAGAIPVRVYVPEGDGPFPVLVYFHGGGWVIGNLDTHDVALRALANRAGSVVASVDYRLAPEHPFPAAPEDCFAATVWASSEIGAFGGDPSRLAVGGDSAGGNLAAVVSQMARDRGGPSIVYQLLVYPAVDASMSSASIAENGDGYLLTKGWMDWFYGHYLTSPTDAENPLVSPSRAESLAGLPPALVITAEFDPLRDEGEAYAAALRAAGVDAEAARYDGMIHGFFTMGAGLSRSNEAIEHAATALRGAFG
jgi:acetyl esterase/lipase